LRTSPRRHVATSFRVAEDLNGLHRHAGAQWLRAAQSNPLNIPERNGQRSLKDRHRVLDIACRAVLECAAIHDLLSATNGIDAPIQEAGNDI